jgi:hypothetical protein
MDRTREAVMAEKDSERKAGNSPAREKVLKHLRAAAVVGASLSMACGPGQSGGKGAGAQTPREPQKPGEHKDGPPMVCDPLPPPVNCDADSRSGLLSNYLYRSARWVRTPTGFVVELRIEVAYWAGSHGLDFAADPRVKGAGVLKVTKEAKLRLLTILPGKGQKGFTVDVPLLCGDRPADLRLDVNTTGTPVQGAPLEVKVFQK